MKNLITLLSFCFICIHMNGQEAMLTANLEIDHSETSLIKVASTTIDLGELTQNIPAKAMFKLTNESNQPMILKHVQGSCGCTATNYEKTPIDAGEDTIIEATYNAKKIGPFQKTVTVQTNLQEKPIILKIKGNVLGL